MINVIRAYKNYGFITKILRSHDTRIRAFNKYLAVTTFHKKFNSYLKAREISENNGLPENAVLHKSRAITSYNVITSTRFFSQYISIKKKL